MSYVFYWIVLFEGDRPQVDSRGCIVNYKGITKDLCHRLRQHCGIVTGGARSTSRRGETWKVVCTVGEFETYKAATQFEFATKQKHKKYRTANLDAAIRAQIASACHFTRSGDRVCKSFHAIVEALLLPHWTATAEESSGVGLEVQWYRPEMRTSDLAEILPAWITETEVDCETKAKQFTLGAKMRPWPILPY